ncbi:MAG: hypothetical protein HYU86_09775 [Chloroflexi bacterium]|nr:hypothetical protein [Chloroflexota bacterium]
MEPIDLCVPIYLDQQNTFGLLAQLEDGFSHLSLIKTSSTDKESAGSGVGGSIGISNVFALLGVSFKGERRKEKEAIEQTEESREKIHTPSSLFAKLRLMLKDRRLLNLVQTEEEIGKLASGQFVEFRAVLRKNPLVDTIQGFKQVMEMAGLFMDKGSRAPNGGKPGKSGRPQDATQPVMRQLDGMLTALTQSDSLELIGELLDVQDAKAVLSAKLHYFSDRNASEIIDGEFRVLGKVIRVIALDSGDTINLLRKTSFGRLNRKVFDKLASAFAGAEEAGVKFSELVTEIRGPALQIIPIAIFT